MPGRQEAPATRELASQSRALLLARLSSEEIRRLCRQYGVRELAVFGSLIGSEFSDASDVDLLVEFQPGVSIGLVAFSRLARELSTLLERKVHVVSKRGL